MKLEVMRNLQQTIKQQLKAVIGFTGKMAFILKNVEGMK